MISPAILCDTPIHHTIEKFLQTALTSRTIGIRNALSLMMRLYPLIKIPPPRFLKNVPSIKIWRSKLPECGRET